MMGGMEVEMKLKGETEMETDTSYYSYWPEPFMDYQVESGQPGLEFYAFVAAYTLLAFILIGPIVLWIRNQKQREFVDTSREFNKENSNKVYKDQNENRKHLPRAEVPQEPRKPPRNALDNHWSLDMVTRKSTERNDSSTQETTTTRRTGSDRDTIRNEQPKNSVRSQMPSSSDEHGERFSSRLSSSSSIGIDKRGSSRTSTSSSKSRSPSIRNALQRQFHQSYPDQDPDFQNHIAHLFSQQPLNHGIQSQIKQKSSSNNVRKQGQQQHEHQAFQPTASNQPSSSSRNHHDPNRTNEVSSSVPSAATTSKLYQHGGNPSNKGFSRRVLDVGGRRWKNRRPIGRVDVIKRNSSSIAESQNNRLSNLNLNSTNLNTLPIVPQEQHRARRVMSDVASTILSEQHHQLHHQPQIQLDISMMKQFNLERLQLQQQLYQQYNLPQGEHRHMLAIRQYEPRYNMGRSSRSSSASALSSIVDDISPNDAADAMDPGRGNHFTETDEKHLSHPDMSGGPKVGQSRAVCAPIEGFLSLATPDFEKWNVLVKSVPLTLGACSEALFRLITIAFISQKLGTESMIAYLLVGLFVRLTSEELAGAIIDALSSFVQASMDRTDVEAKDRSYMAGQYIQLGFIVQVMLNIPLLLVWAIFMPQFVMWLVNNREIANIAGSYASIVVASYMVQALSRTLTVVFQIRGHQHFESVIDLVAAVIQVVAIACILVLVDGVNLNTVAYIQVLITVSSAIMKITYPQARGWIQPYHKGIFQNVALWNYKFGIFHLFKAVVPLFIGSVLEYGEWEILTLCIRSLGPAEVATWALLGLLWDFFEALIEGLAEAAANKICYLLSAGQVDRAKNLSYSAIYMAVIQSVMVTSTLYMTGQYLAVLFTSDPAMQHIMNNTIAMIGVANIIMAYSRISWSVVGSQGRYQLATFVVFFSRWFVTMHCALVSIFVFRFDLNAVAGSLVVGYATACSALTVVVLSSDWDRLVRLRQAMNLPAPMDFDAGDPKRPGEGAGSDGDGMVPNPALEVMNLDDFDDSDDDSDGFGFGDYTNANEDDSAPTEAASKKSDARRAKGVQDAPERKGSERR